MREDWIECKFDDVFFTTSGGTPSRRNENYYNGNIPWIKSGELKSNVITEAEEFISEEAVINSSAKIFPVGTILLALYGATIGKIGILGIPAATNQAICGIFETPFVFSKYAYYYLANKKSYLIKQGIGGAQPNISQTILKNLDFSLPPLPEQRAIVKKIESLLSSLDAGVADFKKAQQQLKIYRQAVLKKAFEGDLTKEWRKKNKINFYFQNRLISDIGKVKGGKRLPKGSDYVENSDYPYIRVTDFENFSVNQSKLKYISKETQEQIKRYTISSSDVYISIAGSIGQCGCIPDNLNNSNLTENAAKITELKDVNKWYLVYYLNSPIAKDILKFSTIGNTQPKLALFRIEQISIPIPRLKEQAQIVKEIESRLSVCDSIEQNIRESLEKAEALRQSILKKAFEGDLLTSQELAECKLADDYEPANILLARIKGEQQNIAKTPKVKQVKRVKEKIA